MNLAATPLSWNACLSALRLDRWMMGELERSDAETVGTHVSACADCSAAVAGMRGVREEVRALPPPLHSGAPPLRRRAPLAAVAGLGLALAAGLVLVAPRRSPPSRRALKGTGLALTMYVQHGGEVRRAAPGESVSPGDAVRFAVSTPSPAYVAVLSLDPAGKARCTSRRVRGRRRCRRGAEVPLPARHAPGRHDRRGAAPRALLQLGRGARADPRWRCERGAGRRAAARRLPGAPVELRQALTALAPGSSRPPRWRRWSGTRWWWATTSASPRTCRSATREMDAARVASVLQEVGGVRPENTVLLQGKDADTVRRALIAVNERVRTAGRPTVLLVYYSGHADAGALHLGSTALELAELEQLVRGSAAGFRLLVLDACRSGALTRVKGGTPIPPFDIQLGERVAGEGAVFLTSSSASEDSQESDELKGSFFTHALLSGLLGAADENGDGRVTLDEAYRYAYETTLRASSRTLAGTQHPTFQYDVRGVGRSGAGHARRALADAGLARAAAGQELAPLPGERRRRGGGRGGRARTGCAGSRCGPGRYFLRGRGPEVLLEGTVAVAPGLDRRRWTSRSSSAPPTRGWCARARAAGTRCSRSRPRCGSARALVTDAGRLPRRGAWGWPSRCGRSRSCPGSPGAGAATPTRGSPRRPTSGTSSCRARTCGTWRRCRFELGLTVGASLLNQSFKTDRQRAAADHCARSQLSPSVGVSRDLGCRTYLYLTVAGATYLFKNEISASGTTSFGPSFAVRVALGFGWRF